MAIPPKPPKAARPADTPLWLLDPSEVREQLLVIASGSKQFALPTGAVDAVDERGRIHPVPAARPLFLGVILHQENLVPLIALDQLPLRRGEAEAGGAGTFPLDPELMAGPFVLVLREAGERLAVTFERFLGFRAPDRLGEPRPPDSAQWVKATGTIDEIPAFVVDTPALFDYCRGRSA